MNIAKPVVTRKLWLSGIWLLPLLSALVGGWVLYQSMIEKGIEISILFDNAEGIREGKTAIIYKGVRIGVVREVHISKNLKQVQARHATSRNSGTPVAIIRSPTQRMGDALNALRPQRLRTKAASSLLPHWLDGYSECNSCSSRVLLAHVESANCPVAYQGLKITTSLSSVSMIFSESDCRNTT